MEVPVVNVGQTHQFFYVSGGIVGDGLVHGGAPYAVAYAVVIEPIKK
jgi:hypothetical protein